MFPPTCAACENEFTDMNRHPETTQQRFRILASLVKQYTPVRVEGRESGEETEMATSASIARAYWISRYRAAGTDAERKFALSILARLDDTKVIADRKEVR